MRAYLIPGWGEDPKDRDYEAVLKVYKDAGYEPVFVAINWNYRTVEDWIEELKSRLSKQDLSQSLLSGFSFGANTALSLAGYYQNPKQLLLFSLSPYYKNDQPEPAWLKAIGKRRADAFEAIDFDDLAGKIKCPTTIFYGSKEDRQIYQRATVAHQKVKNSQLVSVEGAAHDVGDPVYIQSIKQSLKNQPSLLNT